MLILWQGKLSCRLCRLYSCPAANELVCFAALLRVAYRLLTARVVPISSCSYRLPFRYIHDITLASAASLNVIADGAGIDTNLDMHRAASFGNLLTNLNLGLGSRPFQAGGRGDRGAHSGATSKALHCVAVRLQGRQLHARMAALP